MTYLAKSGKVEALKHLQTEDSNTICTTICLD